MEIDYAMRDVSDCGIELGDGISEVAIDNVVPSTQGILYPPAHGIGETVVEEICTWFYFPYGCIQWGEAIVEGDVVIYEGRWFGEPTPDYVGNPGRAIFVHEFGHIFGFRHQGEPGEGMTVMRQFDSGPLTGNTPSAAAFPEDVSGMYQVYGTPPHNKANLIVSAHREFSLPPSDPLEPDKIDLINDDTITVCRGDVFNFDIYVGNKSHVAPSGTVWIGARLNPTISKTAGVDVLGAANTTLGAFDEKIVPFTGYVTYDTPIGLMRLHVDLDPDDLISEVTHDDNWTVSGRRINVISC